MSNITQDTLKRYLAYDENTGIFTYRLTQPHSKMKVGDRAGGISNGRWQIRLLNRRYYGHQLAWLYVTGEFPTTNITHIDGSPLNCRFSNLTPQVKITELNKDTVKELFIYYPETGELRWRVSVGGVGRIGALVGHKHEKSGYCRLFFQGKSYSLHILIWLYMTGSLDGVIEIDHIDTDRSNNKWDNLRNSTKNQNQHNASLRKDNRSGIKGLRIGRYNIECRVALNKRTHYACFKLEEKELAIQWLQDTRSKLHGEYANNG